MNRRMLPGALVLFLLFSVSCVTNHKLTYLQTDVKRKHIEPVTIDTLVPVMPATYKIQPFDNLYIRVMTPDPQWAEMFNTMPATAGFTLSEQGANLISYSVDSEGNIDLPYIGSFAVAGKTLSTLKPELQTAFQAYISDAAVSVKLINNYVSLMGEVQRPGRYPIYKDQLTIFQALTMAGDLNEFSNRQKVTIIRQHPEGNIVASFMLTDRSILESEFYYVLPNDIIYAEPMKGKFFRMNAFPYSVILSTITTFILVLNYIQ